MAPFRLLYTRWQVLISIAVANSPPPCRKSPEMDALLGGKEIVMYGGKGYKLSESGLFLSDTWRLDLDARREWRNLSTQAPAARWKTGTTPVPSGDTWVLFGGCIGVPVSGVQNDLWVFSAISQTWREVSTENPQRLEEVM